MKPTSPSSARRIFRPFWWKLPSSPTLPKSGCSAANPSANNAPKPLPPVFKNTSIPPFYDADNGLMKQRPSENFSDGLIFATNLFNRTSLPQPDRRIPSSASMQTGFPTAFAPDGWHVPKSQPCTRFAIPAVSPLPAPS